MSEAEGSNPRIVILFSGKRKSGKDFITDNLQETIGAQGVIIRLSGPLKECYARDHGLDFQKMLSASDYKEKYRLDMINWSTTIRQADYTYFCKAAIDKYKAAEYPIWIVSDCRRETDFKYFKENFGEKVRTVRIVASEQARSKRGWVFTPSVDDMETECGLDDTDHDIVIDNSGTDSIDKVLEPLLKIIPKQK